MGSVDVEEPWLIVAWSKVREGQCRWAAGKIAPALAKDRLGNTYKVKTQQYCLILCNSRYLGCNQDENRSKNRRQNGPRRLDALQDVRLYACIVVKRFKTPFTDRITRRFNGPENTDVKANDSLRVSHNISLTQWLNCTQHRICIMQTKYSNRNAG